MKKVKADSLATYMSQSMHVLTCIFQQFPEDKKIVEEYKRKFCDANFSRKYEDFEEELRHNILDYKNISIVNDYIASCLGDFHHIEGYGDITNLHIIKNGVEVPFLLRLKLSIEKYSIKINELNANTGSGNPQVVLNKFYAETLKKYDNLVCDETTACIPAGTFYRKPAIVDTCKPGYNEKFDFDTLKTELTTIPEAGQRLQVVRERLYDLQEWQIRYDREETDEHGNLRYPLSEMYYPKMEKLCRKEIERIEKELEYEKSYLLTATPTATGNQPSNTSSKTLYAWNTSDTDLLELSTALYRTASVIRNDGKKMTQKELKEAFEKMFGKEIKDAKAKLSNAVQRKKRSAPFLEKLRNAFEDYTKERV